MEDFTSKKHVTFNSLLVLKGHFMENSGMVQLAKVFLSGLLISFLGALPFGTLNLTAFDISAAQGAMPAFWFALAVVLVELIMVRLTLYGHERLQFGDQLVRLLLPLGILLLLYLSISSFLDSSSITGASSKASILPQIKSTFVLGLLLSALNPLQLPFWFSWNKILDNRGVLQSTGAHHTFYLMGIGLGTWSALGVFITAGKYIFNNYGQYNRMTNLLMGCMYLGFSFYLLFLFIKKRTKYKIQ
ncbi:LysE family transporter [Flagellimonas pelagia]|uniref:Lysine transporter LysE n=1 Tax=Flagellimonas pelagia TaxID=2306998 RepID=A0ABY3KQY3_9FLAO|nr:LysE family transporter [Allomuricauda maritima]TXK00930.1 hypothetical protein FQ017_01640 [Allomuricauda maritima]